jgi:hypothetical protein
MGYLMPNNGIWKIFSHYDDGIFASHYDDEVMVITLRRPGYVHHIATIWLCSSHYDGGAMFDTS